MPDFSTLLTERASAVAELHRSVEQSGWGSIDLKEAVKAGDALKQAASEFQARAAARVALESRAELGHKGFAQREGFKNPEGLLQFLTGVGYQEANRQIENGKMLAEAEAANELGAAPGGDGGGGGDGAGSPDAGGPGAAADPTQPPPRVVRWRELVGDALRANLISVDAADVIRRVLSEIAGTDEQVLTAAAQALMDASAGLSREQLFRRARQLRDVIDAEHIADREQTQRDNRSVKLWIDDHGMYRGIWCLPPEDGVHVAEAFRQIMSPRRPKPKFRTTDTGAVVDTDAQGGSGAESENDDDACADLDAADDHGAGNSASGTAPALEVPADDRTREQRAADGFMDIFRLAGNRDTGTVFGSRTPCVRVVITAERFIEGAGPGHIEGTHEALSAETIERMICTTGLLGVHTDTDGQILNVGRDKRFFIDKQRIGMNIRDGGCRYPGCTTMPDACDAHHINPWAGGPDNEPGGDTNIADGVLLCRFHHQWIHRNKWKIIRDGARYFLRPPQTVDPRQRLLPMPSHSPIMGEARPQADTAPRRKRTTPAGATPPETTARAGAEPPKQGTAKWMRQHH